MEEEDATIRVELQYAKILQAKGLYIAKEETKGRCLLSSKNFTEGSEVLANEPYVAALKQVRNCENYLSLLTLLTRSAWKHIATIVLSNHRK